MPQSPFLSDKQRVTRGILLCLAAALLWSTSGVFIKSLTGAMNESTGAGWSAWQVAGIRSLIAGAVLMALGRTFARPRGHQWIIAGFMGPLMLTYVLAQTYTSTANAIFLQYTAPLYVLALSPWLLKEKFKLADAVAAVVMISGMIVILPSGAMETHWFGSGMALLSGVFYAGLVLSLRKYRGGSVVLGIAWGNFFAAGAGIFLAFHSEQGFITPDFSSGWQIVFLGVFQIGVPYFLFQKGIRDITAMQASLVTLAEPVACPLWAFFFVADIPTLGALGGGALVIGTLAVHALVTRRRHTDNLDVPPPAGRVTP